MTETIKSSYPVSFSLAGRVALVTGAPQGLGFEIARIFAEAGARVVIAGRNAAKVEAAVERLKAGGHKVGQAVFDLDDLAAGEAVVARIEREEGHLDILVNNAAGRDRASIEEITPDRFAAVMHTNVTASFALSRRVVPSMAARGWGRIIMVTSVSGFRANVNGASYGASKAALAGMMRVFTVTYARNGVTCNAIAPGGFLTEYNVPSMTEPARQSWLTQRIPTGRLGQPHEIAGAALFLASDAGTFVNGHELVVDGGHSINV